MVIVMTYYLGKSEQIAGDTAYNALDFEQALIHYRNGYNYLTEIAGQERFTPNKGFKDELAFVITEIIIASSDLIQTSVDEQQFDYQSIMNNWKEILGLTQEMDVIYADIRNYEHRATTQIQYNLAYKSLAIACEVVSDGIIDRVDAGENDVDEDAELETATNWLLSAKNYRRYTLTHDPRLLTRIGNYVQDNGLLVLSRSTMERLEVLSYQLLIAVEKKLYTKASELAQECRQFLINFAEDIDHECLVIQDINQLSDRIPFSSEEEIVPLKSSKKRSHRIILDDDPEDLSTLPSNKMEDLDPTIQTQPVDSYTQAMAEREFEIELPNVALMPQTMSHFEESLAQDDSNERTSIYINPQADDSISEFFQTATLLKTTVAHTFFAPPQAIDTPVVVQKNHRDAFITTMHELANRYQDPAFLANILSLVGDFYRKTSLPFKVLPITTIGLYDTVLQLDKHHNVAKRQKNSLYNSNRAIQRMIDDNARFGKEDGPEQKSPINIFCTAIEDNVDEIETFLVTQPEKVRTVLDALLRFIVDEIKGKNIAGSKSLPISKEIADRYNQLFLDESSSPLSMNI
jgi:hypothetical protein